MKELIKNKPENKLQIFKLLFDFLQEILDIKEAQLFVRALIFCGEFSQSLDFLDYGVFFLNQARIMCDNIEMLWKLKPEIYYKMGSISNQLRLLDISIILLKRALQYSWVFK